MTTGTAAADSQSGRFLLVNLKVIHFEYLTWVSTLKCLNMTNSVYK
jgi:hypothetical protein